MSLTALVTITLDSFQFESGKPYHNQPKGKLKS